MQKENIFASSFLTSWLQGMVKALPIVFGYIPIGFAYGVLAQQAGLSTLNILLMSIIVYAGSSQLYRRGAFCRCCAGIDNHTDHFCGEPATYAFFSSPFSLS